MKKTLEEHEEEITNTVNRGGPYWHNIVGIKLRQVAKQYGDKAANQLIIACRLDKLGWTIKAGKALEE